ncbi:MAG: hypothetical protein ACOCRX_11690 [Candidatus Woesearchaeota archaeon]
MAENTKNKKAKELNQFKSTQNAVEFFELLLKSAKKDDNLWKKINKQKKNENKRSSN